jgi:hypothetical protein
MRSMVEGASPLRRLGGLGPLSRFATDPPMGEQLAIASEAAPWRPV